MASSQPETRFLYWFDPDQWGSAKPALKAAGYTLSGVLFTPCEILRAKNKKLIFAPPGAWSRICTRQGSWYRDSERAGSTMLMSDHRLPGMDIHLDAEMAVTDFVPEQPASPQQLLQVVESDAYQRQKPAQWEGIGIKDAVMFKTMFTATGFWGFGDNLKKHWLAHKANHANFLSRTFTTEHDGEQVPYSLTGNAGVCSSCVEFFNVSAPETRKLVSACPGAVVFGGAERDTYYDVKPTPRPA
ncbi:MAG: hypothetical protein OEY97_08840 [Nitrospirota bacterium]|nr:hypothetical protein [Nitrospirota bacterium]